MDERLTIGILEDLIAKMRSTYKEPMTTDTPIIFEDAEGKEQPFFFEYNPERGILYIFESEYEEGDR